MKTVTILEEHNRTIEAIRATAAQAKIDMDSIANSKILDAALALILSDCGICQVDLSVNPDNKIMGFSVVGY